MAVSKVIYGGNTLIDLTGDTVTSDKLASGTTAHKADGTTITGTLIVQTVWIGSPNPDTSLGSDGDIYIQIEG